MSAHTAETRCGCGSSQTPAQSEHAVSGVVILCWWRPCLQSMTWCARVAALLPGTAATEKGQGGRHRDVGLVTILLRCQLHGQRETANGRSTCACGPQGQGQGQGQRPVSRSEVGSGAVGLAAAIVSTDRQQRSNAKRSFLRRSPLIQTSWWHRLRFSALGLPQHKTKTFDLPIHYLLHFLLLPV